MEPYAAVLLAGGAARRLGGRDKPAIPVAGRPMRDRVLAAVATAVPRVVVGPPAPMPAGVLVTREDPPGGGPVAAIAAGLAQLDAATPVVAVLAGDLPLLTAGHVNELRHRLATGTGVPADGAVHSDGSRHADGAVHPDGSRHADGAGHVDGSRHADGAGHVDGPGHVDGVCYADAHGRRQTLCGVWRHAALRRAVRRLAAERGGELAGASMRALLAGLVVVEVGWVGTGPPPWFDCDTEDDVRRAEEWIG